MFDMVDSCCLADDVSVVVVDVAFPSIGFVSVARDDVLADDVGVDETGGTIVDELLAVADPVLVDKAAASCAGVTVDVGSVDEYKVTGVGMGSCLMCRGGR